MRNTINIYTRKDGRFEGRIPFGRDDNGNLKYRYLYSRNLAELKEKMLNAYMTSEKYSPVVFGKTLQELSLEWLGSAKLRVKESSYFCYEKIVTKHIIPYFKQTGYTELSTPKINTFIEYLLKSGKSNGKGGLSSKTVHDIIVTMRSIAKYAEQEYGLRNPMHNIPIPDFLIDILKARKYNENSFVISGTYKPTDPRTIQNRFKSVLKKCGIRNVNFHLLRHTYATVCIENGFDAKTVSELLGHASVNITVNLPYGHTQQSSQNSINQNLFHCFL